MEKIHELPSKKGLVLDWHCIYISTNLVQMENNNKQRINKEEVEKVFMQSRVY